MGLEGVNNAWVANNHLANMTWYPINKNQEAQEQSEDDEDEEQDEAPKEPYFKWNPGTLADSVNRMFCPHYNDTWGKFASTKWTKESHEGSNTGFLSLEYIHNNVHVGLLVLLRLAQATFLTCSRISLEDQTTRLV
jgi:tyrosinase